MANWAKLQEDLVGLPVAKRAKHGIHFQKSANEFVANFSGKPCHYEDSGILKPIDTKLILLPDGFYGCAHSPVRVHSDGRVKVTGTDYVQQTALPSAKTGLADNDKLIREFSFGKQELRITEDGFKSEITLNRIPTLAEARKLIASESGTLSKEYLKSLTTATDANGDVHTFSTLTAFRTWLAKAVFPVIIDPDFAVGTPDGSIIGSNANYATARTTSSTIDIGSSSCRSGHLPGFEVWRSYFSFDTSSIGAASTVTQTNLKLVVTNEASGTDFDVVIMKQDWSEWEADPTNATKRETAYDGCLSGTQDDAIWRSTSGMSLNTQYASGNLSTAWVNKTGKTYYSLITSLDLAGTQPAAWLLVIFATATHTTESYRPVLTVTYTASGIAIPVAQYYYNRLRRN